MLDINLFRVEKGGDPELVRESQRRRYADVSLVDQIIEHDNQWRSVRFQLDGLLKEFNALNKEIGSIRKAGGSTDELQEKSKDLKKSIQEVEEKEKEVITARDSKLVLVGNLVHDTVPISDDEANNVIVKEFGEPRQAEGKLWNHVDLVLMLDIVDMEAGAEVAGGRGYYLKREGVLLNQALITYALQFGYSRGFSPVHTPFFMRQEIMAECAQLSQFDEELYKVTGEGDDKYLIATSEQTLCAMHRKGWFEKQDLPVKYVGYSTCFRKEAGSHGRDQMGIFRIHQFEKVEQFCITSPEGNASWDAMEEMLGNAEAFYQSLNIPYHVVNIVSKELNNAASKKYDLEAWFPASKAFRELVSCSNCLDYQSRRLDIRVRTPKNQGPAEASTKAFVHMLNSTLTATERTMCCLLENYQTPEGVTVPEALRPFMMGIDFIPFRKTYDAKGKLIDKPKPATKEDKVPTTVASPAYATRERTSIITRFVANQSLYEVLGIDQAATEQDIKRSYRRKALKLHPDVNKAADAQQQFMEAKMAFETLSDNRKRAEYDRRLRMGKGGASDWRSDGYGGSGGRTGGSRAQKPESSYSLEDLLRDLNNELSAWDKARRARKAARASSSSNSNKSQKGLLEELTEVGEKFVDFLEDAFGTLGAATQDTAGTGDNSKSSKPRSSVEEFDHLYASYGERLNQEAAASRQQQQQRPPPATSTAKSEEDIDAMLADLKRKVRR